MERDDHIAAVSGNNDDKASVAVGDTSRQVRMPPLHPLRAAESETQDELARISHVATMLRAQKFALAFEGDDASGWAASILQATIQPGITGAVGYGATRGDAAEDAWRRHIAPNPDSAFGCSASRGAVLGSEARRDDRDGRRGRPSVVT